MVKSRNCSQILSSGHQNKSNFVAGGKITDDETLVIYEVLEYANHRKFGVDQNLRFGVTLEHISVHPTKIPEMTDKQKAQVEEGKRIVTECIQRAIQ